MRDLEGCLPVPALLLQAGQGSPQVVDPVNEDRSLPLDVVGKQEQGRRRRELDRRHPGSHGLDCKDEPAAEYPGEVFDVPRHVGAGTVKEIELLEGRHGVRRRISRDHNVAISMTFLRIVLGVFSIVNVVFWALLAWVWAVKPAWAGRIPLQLGTTERYGRVPAWARLAAAVAAFWAVAGVLYLVSADANPLAFIALFVLAAILLILGIGAAARVYQVLQLPKSTAAPTRQQRAV